MKQILVMVAAVVLVGCGKDEPAPYEPTSPKTSVEAKKPQPPKSAVEEAKEQSPIVEKVIRKKLEKPEGELTEADLAKVTSLALYVDITDVGLKELLLGDTQITDTGLAEVAKLKKLRALELDRTQITKVGVAELQKALPKCSITHNAKK